MGVCFANRAASPSDFEYVVPAGANPIVVIDNAPAAVRANGSLTVMGSVSLEGPRRPRHRGEPGRGDR